MTDKDIRAMQADALLAFKTAEQDLALARERAFVLGKQLKDLGSLLQSQPDNVDFSAVPFLDGRQLTEIVADVRTALAAVQAAQEKAVKLGCPMH